MTYEVMKTKSTKKTKKQGLQINFSNYFNFLPSLITGDNSSMTIIYDINFVCAYDCRICLEKVLFDSQRCFFLLTKMHVVFHTIHI